MNDIVTTMYDDCQRADVSAYLDGELDDPASRRFEEHARSCQECMATLAEQRRLLCVLDVALSGAPTTEYALPKNFAHVITARAQTDMSRVRHHSEKKRAFLLCMLLASLSFALLGAGAFKEAFAPLRAIVRALMTAFDILGHTVSETLKGVALVLHAIGNRAALAETESLRLILLLIFASTVVLLFRLIGNYHRTRLPD